MGIDRKKLISAEGGPSDSVIYYDEDGNKVIRYRRKNPGEGESSRAWRNHNPGNLVSGPHCRKYGSIGTAGGFAVFPDYETGRNALWHLLKKKVYIDLTLNQFPRRYTGVEPEKPDNKEVRDYRRDISIITKFDMERTIRSLSEKEYEQFINAVERHEGWDFGHEDIIEVQKIIGIRWDSKHVISEFLVASSAGIRWLSRREAISLAKKGMLHAVVVHTAHGDYLRPEYGQTPFHLMVC